MTSQLKLIIEPLSRTERKYLGDPKSPNYVPDSPLIERRTISAEEEEELKEACILALANVQSSDDTDEESFSYLANHIQSHDKSQDRSTDRSLAALPEPCIIEDATISILEDPGVETKVESAAQTWPSSKRTTSEPTDYLTPLTSAGITPGETGKHFFHVAPDGSSAERGGLNESSQANSDLSTDLKISALMMEDFGEPGYTGVTNSVPKSPSIRPNGMDMTGLVSEQRKSEERSTDTRKPRKSDGSMHSAKTPSIDPTKTPASPHRVKPYQKPRSIKRLMTTVRKRRNATHSTTDEKGPPHDYIGRNDPQLQALSKEESHLTNAWEPLNYRNNPPPPAPPGTTGQLPIRCKEPSFWNKISLSRRLGSGGDRGAFDWRGRHARREVLA